MKSIIQEMLSVKKFTDFGAVYWLITVKMVLGILLVFYS
jgi:hypothetical protein